MDALEVFMKAVIGARPARFDPFVLDLPWREVKGTIKPKLRFGVFPEDPVFPIHPPVKHAVNEAIRLLEADGHEIVRLHPEDCLLAKATLVAWALMDLDDEADKVVEAGGELPIPARVRMREEMAKLDWSCIADVDSKPGLARLSALTVKRSEVINSWRKLWQLHQFDAVIGPPAQNTAVEHDEYGIPPYTQMLNFLDVSPPFNVDAETTCLA
jgi:amidase